MSGAAFFFSKKCVLSHRLLNSSFLILTSYKLPLPAVTARIDRFIAEGGKGPYPDME
jgi:hypothetical protein